MRRNARNLVMTTSRPEGAAWLLTMTDLVCLLLAFFVMIFAMQRPAGPSALPPSALSFTDKPSLDSRPSLPSAAYNSGRASALPGLHLDYLAPLLQRQLAEDADLAAIGLRREGDRLVLSVTAATLLASDGRMSATGRRVAGSLAALLTRLSNGVELVGHGDGWSEGLTLAETLAGAMATAGYRRPITVLAQPADAAGVDLVLRGDRG